MKRLNDDPLKEVYGKDSFDGLSNFMDYKAVFLTGSFSLSILGTNVSHVL